MTVHSHGSGDQYLTTREVAEHLSLSEVQVKPLIRQDRLESVKIGASRRISTSAIVNMLNREIPAADARARQRDRMGFDRLDHYDDDLAPAWRSEPGDKLVGVIEGFSRRPGWNGREYTILTIRTDDGERVALHAFRSVLIDELAQLCPKVGQTLGVKYYGPKAKPDGGTYHRYRCALADDTDGADVPMNGPDADRADRYGDVPWTDDDLAGRP